MQRLSVMKWVAWLAIGSSGHVIAAEPTLKVGSFTAEETCHTYVLEWGREVAATASSASHGSVTAADGYGYARATAARSSSAAYYAREWGSEIQRECTQNFPNIRSTLASSLASVGGMPISAQGLTLTGRVTQIGYQSNSLETQSTAVSNDEMIMGVEFQLRDNRGDIVFGGSILKRVLLASTSNNSENGFVSDGSGTAGFIRAQNEIGFAVARAVLFRFRPLQVVEVDEKELSLNYGAPIVPIGSSIIVQGSRSLRGNRLTVVSAMQGTSIAESDARIRLDDVAPGAIVTFVENDDPAANSRVHRTVDLPEN